MRRALAAFLVFAALSAGLLLGASAVLSPQGDQIEVACRTLAGEPSAAAGLTLTAERTCGDHLFWIATLPADAPEQARILFDYAGASQHLNVPWWQDAQPLEVELSTFDEVRVGREGPLGQLWEALSAQTAPQPGDQDSGSWYEPLAGEGTTLHREITLSDYMDELPLSVDYWPATEAGAGGLTARFQDYFPIPVPEGMTVEVQLNLDAEGNLDSCRLYRSEDLALTSACVQDDHGVLFTLCASGALAGALDGSGIPGGWGLYWLDGAGRTLETRWSLPDGERPAGFQADGDTLFFLSRDGETAWLYLLDGDSFELRQRLELFPLDSTADNPVWHLDGEAGFAAVLSPGGGLALLARDDAGSWGLAFTADASALEGLDCSPPYQELRWGASGLDWAFDGERLAVTGPYYGGGAYDWYTAVFADGELAWLGAYSTPLGRSYCEELTYWGTYLDTTCSTPYIDAPYCRAAWTG